jgi:hypothetical protein
MACPTGLAWIATLELLATSGLPRAGTVEPLANSTPAGVERAAELAATMPLGPLLHIASLGTDSISPWYDADRPKPVFALARRRLPIAEAIAARSDIDQLFLPAAATQWFWNDRSWEHGQIGEWLDVNKSSNRFPHTGTIATCSPFPDESAWPSFDAPVEDEWDLCFGPLSRWAVQVKRDARVYEINETEDWVRLVEEFPRVSAIDVEVRDDLTSVGCTDLGDWQRCLVPDWAALAEVYDGVHLSWAGFIRVDAQPISLGDSDMTLMRSWGAERTAWLAPVLTDPLPLPIDPKKLLEVLAPADARWDIERSWWDTQMGRTDPIH